eukprot:50613-Alexandrium_andersonii.AAC.1
MKERTDHTEPGVKPIKPTWTWTQSPCPPHQPLLVLRAGGTSRGVRGGGSPPREAARAGGANRG